MPSFSADYAKPYAGVWSKLFQMQKWNAEAPKTIVEIGSYEGSSALWFAENLLKHPESVLYCIDAWLIESFYHRFLENIGEYRGPAKIVPMKMLSDDALMKLIAGGVVADLVYVDGDHRAPAVLADMVLAFKLLRVGGVMICDDYTWADPRHGGKELTGRPKLAIDAFTSINCHKIRILHGLPIVQLTFVKVSD